MLESDVAASGCIQARVSGRGYAAIRAAADQAEARIVRQADGLAVTVVDDYALEVRVGLRQNGGNGLRQELGAPTPGGQDDAEQRTRHFIILATARSSRVRVPVGMRGG